MKELIINKKDNNNIKKEEYDRLLRYISYLQDKCDTVSWAYNKYERWCEINDRNPKKI